MLRPGVRPGRDDYASARRHLFARNGSQRSGWHQRFDAERINSGRSQRPHRHDCGSKHKQRRGTLFDPGDFANGNVRIARDLRRWRNGNGKRNDGSRHRSHDRRRSAVGNINIVGNIDLDGGPRDVRRIDILGNGGNVGADRNVRLRLQQHHGIVEPDLNLPRHVEQWRPRRNSVGILSDRQSRGQRRASSANSQCVAHYRLRGSGFDGTDATGCALDANHDPVNPLICKREQS